MATLCRKGKFVLKSNDPVTLLGGGALRKADLAAALFRAPRLVAADGGAMHALESGHMPELVVGDMDSLSQDAQDRIGAARLLKIDEQESTDFEKALGSVDAPLILAVGFTGVRIDHELAVYSALAQRCDQRCIVIGAEDIAMAAPRRLHLSLAPASRLSLFPLTRVTGTSTGLRWPIAGLTFDPMGRIGTSNMVDEGEVTLEFDAPGMLMVLPRAALDAAMAGLAAADFFSRPGAGFAKTDT